MHVERITVTAAAPRSVSPKQHSRAAPDQQGAWAVLSFCCNPLSSTGMCVIMEYPYVHTQRVVSLHDAEAEWQHRPCLAAPMPDAMPGSWIRNTATSSTSTVSTVKTPMQLVRGGTVIRCGPAL